MDVLLDLQDKTIDKMKEIFRNDQKRINHALKVLKFSKMILEGEGWELSIRKIVILAAILHDIGIHEAERKYNSNSGKYQEIEGPPIARRILMDLGVEDNVNDRVCYIIGGHHTPSKVDGIDFQIIWESDLLVNIEEDELNKDKESLYRIIKKNFRTPLEII